MSPDRDKDSPARGAGPLFTAALALAAILLLMAFSFACFRAGNPTLGGTAGMAAIGLIGLAVRRLLRALPGGPDDEDPPPVPGRSSAAEVP